MRFQDLLAISWTFSFGKLAKLAGFVSAIAVASNVCVLVKVAFRFQHQLKYCSPMIGAVTHL